MKKGLTELIFILDRSGSMAGLESDTIGGYNAVLKKQKETDGDAVITTVLFDNQYELLHDRIDINAVRPMTEKEYFARGTTALLDAIGKTVNKIANAQMNTAEPYRAEKVMCVIITDGLENASREYTGQQIRALIDRRKKEDNWEFLFLGANIDAVQTAGHFGISADHAQNYVPDREGASVLYEAVGSVVSTYRLQKTGASLPANWKEKIDEDYRKRG